MKKYILFLSAISALAITGCRKIETDGEIQVVVVNGGGGGTTGQTITLQGRINADTILRKQNTYIMKGLVYMVGNHTMTVEAGTTVKGSFSGSDVAALIITRGSKLNAIGTPSEPIIFTSASPNPQSGDWGGIVLCGKARQAPQAPVRFDKRDQRIEGSELRVHGAGAYKRRDDEQRYPDPGAKRIESGRGHVIVESAVVIPGEKDRGR